MISDFSPLEPLDNNFLLFEATKSVILHSRNPSKLIHLDRPKWERKGRNLGSEVEWKVIASHNLRRDACADGRERSWHFLKACQIPCLVWAGEEYPQCLSRWNAAAKTGACIVASGYANEESLGWSHLWSQLELVLTLEPLDVQAKLTLKFFLNAMLKAKHSLIKNEATAFSWGMKCSFLFQVFR